MTEEQKAKRKEYFRRYRQNITDEQKAKMAETRNERDLKTMEYFLKTGNIDDI